MIRKLVIAGALLVISSQSIFADCAGVPYGGFSAGVRDNIKNTKSYRGIEGTLFLGYGAMINPAMYVAGELSGTPGSMPINNNSLKTSYGFAAAVLPGMMISEHSMTYLRLGITQTFFSNASKKSGGQLGVGLQTGLTQNWDLRAEYIYTAYGTVSQDIGAPKSDQANMALVYKFE
jgi:opacity protein-like surface antigen